MKLLHEFRAAVAPPEPTALATARAAMFGDAGPRRMLAHRRAPGLPAGRWPKLALAGAVAAAAAVTVPVLLPGGAATARAWAVDRNSNGTVTVTLNEELTDPSGLQHALDAAGIRAVVTVNAFTTPTNFGCQATPHAAPNAVQMAVVRAIPPQGPQGRSPGQSSWVITPAAMPADDTLYFMAQTSPDATVVMVPEVGTAGSHLACGRWPRR